MTTKDQERKALAQIRKIVEGLGENSYIAMAFEGCFEIAEENIDNDFGCSMKNRAEAAEAKLTKANELLELAEAGNNVYENRISGLEVEVEKKNECIEELRKDCSEAKNIAIKNWNCFREQEDRADALEQEIIKLKAKLYDMMMAAAE